MAVDTCQCGRKDPGSPKFSLSLGEVLLYLILLLTFN